MGKTRGFGSERCEIGCRCGRHQLNAGSFSLNRANLDAGAGTRFERKYAPPSIGDRFGELTVLGFRYGNAGGIAMVIVQCSCGAFPHEVHGYNLRKGASTRCKPCGQQAAIRGRRKAYRRFEDAMPDQEHRTRLLSRIGAAITRCTSPNDAGWANYGGRGIRVHEEWITDRAKFLAYITTVAGWDNPALEMDRENTNGHYEPGNLRFITKRQNMLNRRTVQGLQQRITELEAENADLRSCLRRIEEAIYSLD